jgi:predicted Zn-dependent protease
MKDITLTFMSPNIVRGRELLAREAYDQAYEYFENMLKSEPNNAIAKSYIGYLTAVFLKSHHQGLEICLDAVKMQEEEPLCYLNLAKVYVLVDNRHSAVKAIQKGLQHQSSPYKKELLNYYRYLGIRKKPSLAFLKRDNPLNVLLGKLKKKK